MDHLTFDKGFWKSFIWFLVIALLICCLPWLLAKHSWIDFSTTGEIGDTIGGIMGPFIAIAAAGLTFIAFWVQYKANIQQRHDIAIERFESNLFEMIHIQQEITNGLLVEYFNETKQIREISKGREVFRRIYLDFQNKIVFPDGNKKCTLFVALNNLPDLKTNLSKVEIMWNLDHYFRHLYRIFKYIDDGASMYKIFEKNPTLNVIRLSCLVHIRRYFLKSMKFEDKTGVAYRFLERIRLIYELEKSYKNLTDEERQEQRALDVIPILNDMYQDLLYYANTATAKCGELLMKAINYAKAEWKGLIRYTEDGKYRVDNNAAESIMRDLACGRKNCSQPVA